MNKPKTQNIELAENRRARHNYTIEDTFECGMVLRGSEVKSLRERRLNFADAYAMIRNGEIFVIGLRIDKYKQATHEDIDPERTRKLLLRKQEIARIERILRTKKATLVPLKLYIKNGRVKLLLGLGIGKGKADKREAIKERDIRMEISRAIKRG